MKMEFKDQVTRKIINFQRELSNNRMITALGQLGILIIDQRTRQGKDYSGKGFRQYSDQYVKKRRKSGRGLKVDLTWSGNMLNALTARALSSDRAKIFFSRGEESRKAFYHHVSGAGKGRIVRPFFSLDKEKGELVEEARRYIKKAQRRVGL